MAAASRLFEPVLTAAESTQKAGFGRDWESS
jgi:hypothetical protein